jgi:hypothetical protein
MIKGLTWTDHLTAALNETGYRFKKFHKQDSVSRRSGRMFERFIWAPMAKQFSRDNMLSVKGRLSVEKPGDK